MDENKSLKDTIVDRMDQEHNKLGLATSIIEQAKKGDRSALAIIDKLLTEKASSDEETKFPIDDKRFWIILCAAVDRHRGITF